MTNGERPLAVLDTNVPVSGVLSEGGAPRRVLLLIRYGVYRTLVSQYLLDEYDDVLSRPYPSNKLAILGVDRRVLIASLFEHTEIVVPISAGTLQVRDEKDQRILETALSGNADFLVSGDKDLHALTGHPDLGSLQIVDPPTFLEYLASLA